MIKAGRVAPPVGPAGAEPHAAGTALPALAKRTVARATLTASQRGQCWLPARSCPVKVISALVMPYLGLCENVNSLRAQNNKEKKKLINEELHNKTNLGENHLSNSN